MTKDEEELVLHVMKAIAKFTEREKKKVPKCTNCCDYIYQLLDSMASELNIHYAERDN